MNLVDLALILDFVVESFFAIDFSTLELTSMSDSILQYTFVEISVTYFQFLD